MPRLEPPPGQRRRCRRVECGHGTYACPNDKRDSSPRHRRAPRAGLTSAPRPLTLYPGKRSAMPVRLPLAFASMAEQSRRAGPRHSPGTGRWSPQARVGPVPPDAPTHLIVELGSASPPTSGSSCRTRSARWGVRRLDRRTTSRWTSGRRAESTCTPAGLLAAPTLHPRGEHRIGRATELTRKRSPPGTL